MDYKMKLLYYFFVSLIVSSAGLFLNQFWLFPIEPELFWRILITIAILAVVAIALHLSYQELVSDSKLKKDKFID